MSATQSVYTFRSYAQGQTPSRFVAFAKTRYTWGQLGAKQNALTIRREILEEASSMHAWRHLLDRKTPVGLSEQDLLIAINRGNVASLQRFPGIGEKIANNVLQFRKKQKVLSSIDELIRIPLIGEKRFQTLVGRNSLFSVLPIHALMRKDPEITIYWEDLIDWEWPAPGIPRIALVDGAQKLSQQEYAKENRLCLRKRKVGNKILFFHFQSETQQGWAKTLWNQLGKELTQKLKIEK